MYTPVYVDMYAMHAANPAKSCGAILKVRKGAIPGVYYINPADAVLRVYCAYQGKAFVSFGGDGTSKALAGK